MTKIIRAPSLRLSYVILPKCGCTSAKSYLCTAEPSIPLSIGADYTTVMLEGLFGPYTIDLGVPARLAEFPDDLVFTFLRDPISRLLSLYNEKVYAELYPPLARFGIVQGMEFSAFAAAICDVPDTEADDHFCSQSYMITDKGRLVVNFAAPVERMSELLPKLLAVSGHSWSGSVYNHRVTRKVVARDMVPADMARRIIDRYAIDAHLYERVTMAPFVQGGGIERIEALRLAI